MERAEQQLARVPFGTDPADVLRILSTDGGLVLENVLTRDEVDAVNRELDEAIHALAQGNFDDGDRTFVGAFYGRSTKRLQHCVKYSPTYREKLVGNAQLAAYLSLIVPGAPGHHSLYSSQAIEIFPGEKLQALHRDGGGFDGILTLVGPSGRNVIANTLLALTDVTEEMGATRVIPGSHLWDESVEARHEDTIPATMNAGDVLFYGGRVLHGGGANVTADRSRRVISTAFSLPFFMGEEAWPFVVSVDEARGYPRQVQQMMGFRSIQYRGEEPGFLWRVHTKALEEFAGL